jgi:hypothetical protein
MKKRIIFDFNGVLADSLSITMDNINFCPQMVLIDFRWPVSNKI